MQLYSWVEILPKYREKTGKLCTQLPWKLYNAELDYLIPGWNWWSLLGTQIIFSPILSNFLCFFFKALVMVTESVLDRLLLKYSIISLLLRY